ncbi:TIM-barrel domain-containing protein [Prevotella sp. MA2016]|uniref:TIM-barrel domain-containing protein n=1 Tax=Prevotella sp. MA2016 TaxID=1408310 RepID=UPI00048F7DA1|nr:TIM-barrel domain-containing protein [Prevotella sp. MA2016]
MKRILTLVIILLSLNAIKAQTVFMTTDSVAVFYPAHYDAKQHQPSPIFEQEPAAVLPLADQWPLHVVFSQKDGHSLATIQVADDVDFYGTGEVTGPLRRNGRTIELWNVDTPAYGMDGGTHLYQSHPWVMGLRKDGTAFGIIADNTWRQKITTADHQVVFDSEGPAFRVVVIERQSPQALMQALVSLTGTMSLPPLWSLGYQQCKFSYYPDTQVMEVADKLRSNRIPSDVIWMDIDYMDGYRIFTFDPKGFSNPKKLNDYLHQHNFKSVYMIDPGVKAEEGYFVDDQGTAGDYWVKTKDGKPFVGEVWPGAVHFPDFTRPEVRTWWATLYKDFMAQGVDGVWNDMNEPASFGLPETTMPRDNQHLNGDGGIPGPHLRFHNVFGMNMVRASRQGLLLANPQKRPFILSRSNFLGGHRYAATWTGDNLSSPDHMKLSVPMTLTLGLSGQPFNGPDIGGFCENSNAELLAQWTAVGVYFPFVRNHNTKGTVDQEPWAFDGQVLDVCRTAINRRYMLMPYIYTCFREASVDGMPVMRPLFMSNPKDLSLRSEDRAFLLGADLMVRPQWATEVAQPDDGSWQPFTLENNTDSYQAELRQRPGSIIPLANLAQSTAEMRTDSLTLLVCVDANGQAQGQLYEDKGDGFDYKKGDYRLTELKAVKQKKQLKVTLCQKEGSMAPVVRQVRVGFVSGGKVKYTPWKSGDALTFTIK